MKSSKSAVLTALFSLCLMLIFFMFYKVWIIEIKSPNSLCKLSTNKFSLQWKHSVEKTEWIEHYQRQNDYLILHHSDLVSFGAGTPSHYPIIFQKDGVIRMLVNQKMSDIRWTISKNMQGNILIQQKVWKIHQDFPDYTLIEIRPKHYSLWKIWQLGECL